MDSILGVKKERNERYCRDILPEWQKDKVAMNYIVKGGDKSRWGKDDVRGSICYLNIQVGMLCQYVDMQTWCLGD